MQAKILKGVLKNKKVPKVTNSKSLTAGSLVSLLTAALSAINRLKDQFLESEKYSVAGLIKLLNEVFPFKFRKSFNDQEISESSLHQDEEDISGSSKSTQSISSSGFLRRRPLITIVKKVSQTKFKDLLDPRLRKKLKTAKLGVLINTAKTKFKLPKYDVLKPRRPHLPILKSSATLNFNALKSLVANTLNACNLIVKVVERKEDPQKAIEHIKKIYSEIQKFKLH